MKEQSETSVSERPDPLIYDCDPYYSDDDDYDPCRECDHTDGYDMDLCTGRCVCDSCGHSWYATSEEVNAELDRQARYYDDMERENRRQWWSDFFASLAFWRRWRKRPTGVYDDEIPF